MSANSKWHTQQDVMNDILMLSEIEGASRQHVEEQPPATIVEYRARMAANNNSSVYDNPEVEDDVTYIISGRGRGGISMILRPGFSSISDNQVTEDVQKKLRQVSGLGYSNDFIVQGVKAMTIANTGNKSSLVKTSDQTFPSKTDTSGLHSPLENIRSSSSSSTAVSPQLTVPEDSEVPPPLSVIRKRAQEERAVEKQQAANKDTQKTIKLSSRRNSKSADTRNVSPYQSAASESSSDEPVLWRTKNNACQFFQPNKKGFQLNVTDFPALK